MRNTLVAVLFLACCICFGCVKRAEAKHTATHKAATHAAHSFKTAAAGARTSSGRRSTATASRSKRGSKLAARSRRGTIAGAHRGRHHGTVVASRKKSHNVAHATHTRYAYPMSFFMLNAPTFERSPLPRDTSDTIARSFSRGFADEYAARSLVRAGIVTHHPLHGGIFWRREPIKYIIVHSTETGIPVSAERVIEGWNSNGRRHAGAQYVVDRDGTIFQAVDPDLGTVHVNIFKTLPGINNDNSIGIEMNHTGRQDYPTAEREAVIRLVTYLQERYKVPDENVITHRYAQQGDHTDPVNFDWEGFLASKNAFKSHALAYKVKQMKDEVKGWKEAPALETVDQQPPPAFLQPHKAIEEKRPEAPTGTQSTGGTPAATTTTPSEIPILPSSSSPPESVTPPAKSAPVPGAEPSEMDPETMPEQNAIPTKSE